MWFGKNIVWQPVLLCTVSAQIIETCLANARQYIRGPGDHVVLHLPVHIRNPQTGNPRKKNILKKIN